MIRILRHFFFLAGMTFIAVAFTNAYFADQATVNSNSFTTSRASFTDVVLNEIYANPPGSNESNGEWVEIYNKGDWAWDANGWRLKDASDHILVIDSTKTGGSTVVPPHGWLVINRNGDPNFSLNNGAETVYLIRPDGVADTFSYTTTTEDKSWARRPDGVGPWFGNQTPTPGGTNGP